MVSYIYQLIKHVDIYMKLQLNAISIEFSNIFDSVNQNLSLYKYYVIMLPAHFHDAARDLA